VKGSARRELEKRERQFEQRLKREQRRQRKLARKFQDWEPEQAYGTHHDIRRHIRFGGELENY